MKIQFPDPESADENGILCWSRDINVDYLLGAYGSGIFPWPSEEDYVVWFAPPQRAVLFLDEFHISERTRRYFRKSAFCFDMNRNFAGVMKSCASVSRKGENGTWITRKIMDSYTELYERGFAASFEAYSPGGILAGGTYGVLHGKYFSAESMFHTEDNASKFALSSAVEYLLAKGVKWIDVQVMNPFIESLGCREVSRAEFTEMLKASWAAK